MRPCCSYLLSAACFVTGSHARRALKRLTWQRVESSSYATQCMQLASEECAEVEDAPCR